MTQLLGGLSRVAPDVDLHPFYSWILGRGRDPVPDRRGAAAPPLAAPPRRAGAWLRRVAQGLYDTAFELTGAVRGFRLYHEPNHIPLTWHGPIVTTIHDLSVLRHPEWHPADRVDWYRREFEAGVTRTEHFITVSRFTCDEMVDLLGVSRNRITPIPLGVGPEFRPLHSERVAAWRARGGLPASFLLFVGTLEPRKNLPGLLEAYAALPADLRARHSLVLAGIVGWGHDDVLKVARSHGVDDQVRLLGYVPDEDLPWLYNAAHALVWPTFYEGFGLPPLEAMACGTPVVTSSTSSLPEVVGDAAILVDPCSVTQIAGAMRRVLEDACVLQQLAIRGQARAGQFSWDRCAAAHAELYRRFAEE